jgi:hypothetical protein
MLVDVINNSPFAKYMHETGTNKDNDFWIGPFGIRVKNDVKYVPAEDGINQVGAYGTLITQIKNMENLTEKEYINTFCYMGGDCKYYYNQYKFHRDQKYTCIGSDGKVHFCNIYELYNIRSQREMDDCRCLIM